MLLLVTGASGIGKTVRRLLDPQLRPQVECSELGHLSPNPKRQDLEWRQRTTELAVQRAVQLQRDGRHLLLCGDPIAAVEVAAAPSATHLAGMAFCLFDAAAHAQTFRLDARGDPPSLLHHHHAFAAWMRQQSCDPMHMLEVVTTSGWGEMRWDRIPALAPQWAVHTVETTDLAPHVVAEAVRAWIHAVLAGDEPSIDPGRI